MTTKRRFIKHLPLMLAGLAMGLGVFINDSSLKSNNSIETNASVGNYSTNASTYYNGITASSGKQLAAQLHDLITSTHKTYTTYADNGANLYQTHTDQYYENGNAVSGYIYEFYSGVKWPSAWDANAGSTTGGYNREHCWCQSNSVPSGSSSQLWGENGGGADMHHLRPAENRLNSTRGNDKYGVVSNRDSYKVYAKYGSSTTYHGGYSNSSTFEPLDSKKGDVARIILYVYLHYNTYSNSTLFGSYGTTNGNGSSSYFATSLLPLTNIVKKDTEAQAIQLMLDWNTSDPVDEIEQRRNEQVAIYQGNRNPFIDNSNYANLIWGSGSSSSDPAATISPSSASVAVDGTVTLTATLSNVTSAGAITWASSDVSKATVSKGTTLTTSSIATVTGVAAGTATISCKYNGTTIGTASVTVTTSGGSSGDGTLTISVNDIPSQYTGTSFTVDGYSFGCSNIGNSYSSGSMQWKSGQGYLYNTTAISGISSISMATSGGTFTGTVYTGSSSHPTSGTSYTLTNGNSVTISGSPSYFTIQAGSVSGGAKCGDITITYGSSSTQTLSSIAVSTAPTKTTYNVGEYFNPTGLVITRNYSNGSPDTYAYAGHTSEFTFDPSTSTALTVSHTSVTIGYGGKTCTQAIIVNKPAVTSITASVSKTFYVGETITKSDISVTDSNGDNVNDFTFSNNNYQFTYSDAASGGVSTSKTFTNAISGSNKTCSLTVQVQRKAFVTPSASVSDTLTRSTTGISNGSTDYSSWSGKKLNSNAIYAGQSAGGNDSIQLRSNNNNSGIVQTASGGQVTRIDVSWNSNTTDGRTINIYGKNSAFSSPADLYSSSTQGTLLGSISKGTTSFTVSGDYTFIGIRSVSGALYLTSVTFNFAGSSIDASNLANYIMYEDTNNQCTSKLTTVVGYIQNMSSDEKSSFQNSNDYVISTARTRLNAWAAHEGKTINWSTGTLSNTNRLVPLGNTENNNNTIIMLIIVSMVGVTSIGACLYIRKKRSR